MTDGGEVMENVVPKLFDLGVEVVFWALVAFASALLKTSQDSHCGI